jgi:ribosomal silencing factor RsfS
MTGVEPKQKARWIVEAALDRKAERPIVLDMRNLTFYADTFARIGRSARSPKAFSRRCTPTARSRSASRAWTMASGS